MIVYDYITLDFELLDPVNKSLNGPCIILPEILPSQLVGGKLPIFGMSQTEIACLCRSIVGG